VRESEGPAAGDGGARQAIPTSSESPASNLTLATTQAAFGFMDAAPLAVDPGAVIVNPDGVSIKGCTLIYAPKGLALEYAPLATNPYRGCGHSCSYPCYVPDSTHQARAEFNAGAVLRPNFITDLRREAAKYQAAGITEQVLLSFTTDPYHPGDTKPTREVLEILIEHGLGMSVLTKGGTRALRDLDLFRPDRDAFATTLTSLDDDFSRKWESKAPLPGDRIMALKLFHDAGIYTWVSLEPVLNAEATLAVVRATHSFVDLYKIGKLNYSKLTQVIDWRDFTLRMIDLFQRVRAKHYFKRDLQEFLPPGYHNPMRVPQHHGKAP
jgi:Radical SAM superfamily